MLSFIIHYCRVFCCTMLCDTVTRAIGAGEWHGCRGPNPETLVQRGFGCRFVGFRGSGCFFFKLLNPRSDNGFLCFRASGAQLGVLRLSPGVRVEIFRLPNLLNPNTHDTPEPIGDLGVVPAQGALLSFWGASSVAESTLTSEITSSSTKFNNYG